MSWAKVCRLIDPFEEQASIEIEAVNRLPGVLVHAILIGALYLQRCQDLKIDD